MDRLCSPRTRGWFAAGVEETPAAGVLPVRAGVVRHTRALADDMTTVLPARGDGPSAAAWSGPTVSGVKLVAV